jgi:hypothetical protein
MPTIALGEAIEEVAHHEAGQAALEEAYGFTPKLLVLTLKEPENEGFIFTNSSVGIETVKMRMDKSVAGVLSQALYVARMRWPGATINATAETVKELVAFFTVSPTVDRHCTVPFLAEDELLVDLCRCYSQFDHFHFKVALTEAAEQRFPGTKFNAGAEPECLAIAEESVQRVIECLHDVGVWHDIRGLANKLLQSQTIQAKLLHGRQFEGEMSFASFFFHRNRVKTERLETVDLTPN